MNESKRYTKTDYVKDMYSLFVTVLLIMVTIFFFQMSESYKEVVIELNVQKTDSYKLQTENLDLVEENDFLKTENRELRLDLEEKVSRQNDLTVSRKQQVPEVVKSDSFEVVATAYDLAYASCGKTPSDPAYGITANGTNLQGKTRAEAMTIAVDPKVIPLGSKVEIVFSEPYTHFNGIYTARDKGGAIKGNKIDVFMGDFNQTKSHPSTLDFGRRTVKVSILK